MVRDLLRVVARDLFCVVARDLFRVVFRGVFRGGLGVGESFRGGGGDRRGGGWRVGDWFRGRVGEAARPAVC